MWLYMAPPNPLASSSPAPNPLNNPLVIDKICSFLHPSNLTTCRLINKKWNSHALHSMRRRGRHGRPCIYVYLTDERIITFLEFIESRNPAGVDVEWHPEEAFKYSFQFGDPAYVELLKMELQAAVELLQRAGHNFHQLQGVSASSPWEENELLEVCVLLEEITAGAQLESLQLHIDIPLDFAYYVSGIIASPRAISALSLFGPTNGQLLSALEFAGVSNHAVLDTVEILRLNIEGLDFEDLHSSVLRFAKLRNLQFNMTPCLYGVPDPEEWGHFQSFLRDCPKLVTCSFVLVGVPDGEVQESLRAAGIPAAFARIHFRFGYSRHY